jgi:hypothetical protein
MERVCRLARDDFRVLDGGVLIFAKVPPHPGDAFPTHIVVGVGQRFDGRYGSDMSAQDNGGMRRELAHHAAHFARFTDIRDNRSDANDVVGLRLQFARERFAGSKG